MITVVGIGADGWDGLAPASRRAIAAADVLLGSRRQLDLVPDPVPDPDPEPSGGGSPRSAGTPSRVVLPSPLLPNLEPLLESFAGREVCVLASGDPMFYGIGSTLVRLLGADQVRVLPHVSSVSLACARLGWPVEQVEVVSAVGRPLDVLRPALAPGRRVLVLGSSPEAVTRLLGEAGYAASRVTVLSDLGAATESVRPAAQAGPTRLHVIAIECALDPGAEPLPRVPGLPDDAYDHDGRLTKREVRAVTLSRLAPLPGELLWDVG
ncbi:MAG: precorrin-6y C5,15-methyltransferase (decarboxylating) subunit CbiE, partial [Micromonosporaceae bacterium]|nr:precorrin-6y C5,15-methyltransferase (decarboxylating) subunit CbiE [Micromonosporaceae bacterium]